MTKDELLAKARIDYPINCEFISIYNDQNLNDSNNFYFDGLDLYLKTNHSTQRVIYKHSSKH